jgi:hypothetical protein
LIDVAFGASSVEAFSGRRIRLEGDAPEYLIRRKKVGTALALARDGYMLVRCEAAVFKPEA